MRKYWHVINVGLQNTMAYRLNFLFRAAFGLIPLMATIYLWRTIYEGRDSGESIGGYELSQMISYYLVVTIVDALTAVNEDDWQIATDIRDGQISQFLLKPIDYLTYRLSLFAAGRLVYVFIAAIPVGLFIGVQSQHFVVPADATTLVLFLVSTFFTALLQFLISYSMALLAFWLLEVGTFIFILFAFEYLAGGHLFPLDLLPAWLHQALGFTPFPYLLFFPASIYLNRVEGAALWQGLAIQVFWVACAYLMARWVWSRGIRKYSAVGG